MSSITIWLTVIKFVRSVTTLIDVLLCQLQSSTQASVLSSVIPTFWTWHPTCHLCFRDIWFHLSRSSQVPPRSRRCWYNAQPRPGVRKHYRNNFSFPSDSSGEVCSHCTHATYSRSAFHISLLCFSSRPSWSSFTPLSW